MLALLGPGAVSGPLLGFATLCVFGLALSLPLVPLAFSERTAKLIIGLGLRPEPHRYSGRRAKLGG